MLEGGGKGFSAVALLGWWTVAQEGPTLARLIAAVASSVSAKHFAGPRVATIYGTIYATNALGAACGSLLGGVLHDLTDGYRSGFLCSLAFILLAAAPFWTVKALRNFR